VTSKQKRQFGHWLFKQRQRGVFDREGIDTTLGRLWDIPECCIKNYNNITRLGIYAVADWMDSHFGSEKHFTNNEKYYVRCVLCRK